MSKLYVKVEKYMFDMIKLKPKTGVTDTSTNQSNKY